MSCYRIICAFLLIGLILISPAAASDSSRFIVTFHKDTESLANALHAITTAGGSLVRHHEEIGVAIADSDNPSFSADLKRNAIVQDVIRDRMIRGADVLEHAVLADEEPPAASSSSLIDPRNAVFLRFQWNLRSIRAPEAWNAGHTGDPNVLVAVVDSGLDYTHLELQNRVDLSRSVSFLPEEDDLVQQRFPGAHAIADLHAHGTMVAGLITCNAVGTACIAPNATLVGVKVLNNHNDGPASAMISGITYAASIGADVITAAFIVLDADKTDPEDRGLIAAFNRGVNFATSRGALVVADAGAGRIDADKDQTNVFLPAQTGNALAVSGTSITDELGLSNFGASLVSVAAPSGILTGSLLTNAILGPCSSFSIGLVPGCQRPNPTDPFRYLFLRGQALPVAHAAGVAVLIDSTVGGAYNAAQLRARLQQTAADIGKPGFDKEFGHGKVDAFAATQ